MKLIKKLLLTTVSVFALAAPAHAELGTIGSVIFQTLYTIGLPGAVANALGTIGAYALIGAAALAPAFLQRGRQSYTPSQAKNTFTTSESPLVEGVGRGRVGGTKVFGNTDGSTRWRLIARLVGPISQIEEYWVGGREVVVESNGNVSSPPYVRSTGSWLKIEDKIGDGTETAWPALMSAFPTIWTSAHWVRGLAQSLVTYLNPGLNDPIYLKLYQGGVADTEWVGRLSPVYDASDPAQSPTDRATWQWSENAIWNTIHMLRRDPRLFNPAMFDWEHLKTQAILSDTLVATKTGFEKRARVWGIWSYEDQRSETMKDVLDSAGLELRMTDGGLITLEFIDDVPSSEISLTDRDIVEDAWQGGPEAVERPNELRLFYYSPERDYEMTQIDLAGYAWARNEDEIAAYGHKPLDVQLKFCPSASQAQRIGRRKFALARADRGVITNNMVGMATWGRLYGDVLTEHDDAPQLVRFDPPRVNDNEGTVEIPLTYWPSLDAWDPATMEADAPTELQPLGYSSSLATPAAPTSLITVTYPVAGTKELRMGFSIGGTPTVIEAIYRPYAGGLPGTWQSLTEVDAFFAWKAGDFEGVAIDTRVRWFDENDEVSDFSDILHVDALAQDNTLPNLVEEVAASIVDEALTVSVDLTLSTPEIRVCGMRISRRYDVMGGGSSYTSWVQLDEKDYRPGSEINLAGSYSGTAGTLVQFKIEGLTANGTPGAARVYTLSVTNPH